MLVRYEYLYKVVQFVYKYKYIAVLFKNIYENNTLRPALYQNIYTHYNK